MNKKELIVDIASGKFEINSASHIINIKYDQDKILYIVEYYESPFKDELDVYQLADAYLSNFLDNNMNNYIGYTFYGEFYDRIQNDNFLLFAKKVDRIKVK